MVTAQMGELIAPTVILIVILILIFVYSALPKASRGGKTRSTPDRNPGKAGEKPLLSCPICGIHLQNTERVKSYVYRAGSDCLSHIFGCPHCIPGKTAVRDRICPVCRKVMPEEGYLIARMFERTDGAVKKNHVHVLGCTGCRKMR